VNFLATTADVLDLLFYDCDRKGNSQLAPYAYRSETSLFLSQPHEFFVSFTIPRRKKIKFNYVYIDIAKELRRDRRGGIFDERRIILSSS